METDDRVVAASHVMLFTTRQSQSILLKETGRVAHGKRKARGILTHEVADSVVAQQAREKAKDAAGFVERHCCCGVAVRSCKVTGGDGGEAYLDGAEYTNVDEVSEFTVSMRLE